MIIDIGSGHKPDNKANILLEYSGAGDEHRWHKELKVDRSIIFYNTEKMPFKDKTFEKTICKHVLEHVDNPSLFLKELERISMGGYIETPSEIAELVFTPYDQHKWVINLIAGRLLIKKKTEYNISKLNNLFDFLCDNERGFEDYFYWKRRALFFIEYYWKESIDFKIIPNSKNTELDLSSDSVLKKISTLNKVNARRNTSFKYSKYSIHRIHSFLEKNIESPCCNFDVTKHNDSFVCGKCKTRFPINGQKIDLSLSLKQKYKA